MAREQQQELSTQGRQEMSKEEAIERARRNEEEGQSRSTMTAEFVREEIHFYRVMPTKRSDDRNQEKSTTSFADDEGPCEYPAKTPRSRATLRWKVRLSLAPARTQCCLGFSAPTRSQ